ncbi:hypothetical protein [Pseudanabaena yagii]|uniref:NB-ARC domain-containing protein n=1 Tax=Pseudanabaena yagii GIHE-NHR1 TaxID=2722753 RepID=A0ABX1LVT1_9CYAN|nr:hypothetical protein [Pseudanabaena yagii]NMF59126.1 hypothetical protein [Pseudanabaena yagii GIHE-NHR1]
MTNKREQSLEPLIAAANELISSVPIIGAFISAPIAAGMVAWQNKNLNNFILSVKQKFASLEESKIDYAFLETDQFKDIILQTLDAAVRTSSEIKCNALANALMFSATLPTSKHIGKQSCIRVISQISDEEILVLQVLYEVEHQKDPKIQLHEIADRLGWEDLDVKVTVYGLIQLGLAYDPLVGSWDHLGGSVDGPQACRISSLGLKCVQYALTNY